MLAFATFSSFSFPNIEYFICCFETQIFAISSRHIFRNVPEYVDNRMIRATPIHSCNSWHLSGHISLLWIFFAICKGIARTQSPTIKNYALELPTFGVIVGVSLTGVQWKGLTLEEPPSWSWLTSAPGKYAQCLHSLWAMNPDPEDQLKQDKDMLSGGGSYTFTFGL